MVYKTGTLKGQLTTAEIRKLISAHNKLTNIKIPKGSNRDDIIKLLKTNGWSVNHEKQSLIPLDRPRTDYFNTSKRSNKGETINRRTEEKQTTIKTEKGGTKSIFKSSNSKSPISFKTK